MTAKQVYDAVASLFSGGGCVVLGEVRSSVGFDRAARTADLLAVSTWPSRGLHADGVEIKVSRGDLMKELANPIKADTVAQYCERWWVATPEGLTDGVLLPPNWGLIEVAGKRAKVRVKAATLQAKPFDTAFCCSVLRNFSESYIPNDTVEKIVAEKVEAEVSRRLDDRKHRQESATKAIQQWKDMTGIDLLTPYGSVIFDMKRVAAAFKILSNEDLQLGMISDRLASALRLVQEVSDAIDGVGK